MSTISYASKVRPISGTRWQTLISSFWRKLLDPYRPELHYMRGPGPKWYAKHLRDMRCYPAQSTCLDRPATDRERTRCWAPPAPWTSCSSHQGWRQLLPLVSADVRHLPVLDSPDPEIPACIRGVLCSRGERVRGSA